MNLIYIQGRQCTNRNDAEAMLQSVKSAGFDTIIFRTHDDGTGAYYNSKLYPLSTDVESGFDPLGYMVRRGIDLGIRVLAWVCAGIECYQFTPKWDIAGKYGAPLDMHWLDYTLPVARARVAAIAADIVSKYAVVGVCLDYIRYPNYSTAWRAAECPQVAVSDITNTVQLVRDKIGPHRLLTVSAQPVYWEESYQDWFSWVQSGLIDYALPMTYVSRPGQLTSMTQLWPADIPRDRLIPTVALFDWDTQPGTDLIKSTGEIHAEADECWAAGMDKLCIYDSKALNSPGMIEQLALENGAAGANIVADVASAADAIDEQVTVLRRLAGVQ